MTVILSNTNAGYSVFCLFMWERETNLYTFLNEDVVKIETILRYSSLQIILYGCIAYSAKGQRIIINGGKIATNIFIYLTLYVNNKYFL